MYTPIRDYGIIGNLRSAVLVSKAASIDWAPAPFIDSPSIFGRILDDGQGGYWQISPEEETYSSNQYYIENTNVLVTEFICQDGVLTVTDFIPIEDEKTFVPAESDTTFRVHRKVHCVSGRCRVRMECQPAFDYARGQTTGRELDGGMYFEKGALHGVLASHIPIQMNETGTRAECTFELNEGESEYFVFRYNTGTIEFKEENDHEHHESELDETIGYWRAWHEQCELDSCVTLTTWRDQVTRSSLLLKILFFEPIGTVAAAPTTSLPEEVGGVRNWDYRFTWLRDSTFIFQALFKLGHLTEARNYIQWLINESYAAAGTREGSPLQIMYGLRGEQVLEEQVLTHLKGYQESKPVRIGNDAYTQDQWDIFGSVFDVIWQLYELSGERIGQSEWSALHAMAEHVCGIWREPDEGLWEVRSGAQHFVYSKVMCWVALDRAVKLIDACGLKGDRERFAAERERIRADIYDRGWSESLQSFVQYYDSDYLDAALLLLPTVGFIDGRDPKMSSTIRAIERYLLDAPCFVRRYSSDDGLPGREGAFLLASFWYVDALTLAGETEKARSIFMQLLEYANHLDLFSEEIDTDTGAFLGNFPQAYTHIGLINSAIRLHEVE